MDELRKVNATTVCIEHKHERFKGIFYGDNPLLFSSQLLMAQLTISAVLDSIFQYFLSPLGQISFVSQILVGIVIGPSCIGRIQSFRNAIFPPQSFYVADTFAFFGVVLFLFVVGVKTDLGIMRRPGKRAIAIGLSTFLLPLILNLICASTLIKLMPMSPRLRTNLYWIALFQSLSNFHVIACFLADLKLLNTELGRLAISSSMVSGFCSWFLVIIFFTIRQSNLAGKRTSTIFLTYFSVLVLIAIVCLVLRPIMFWMVRQTPSEQAVKESHVVSVFIMVMFVSMFGEIIGQHFLFGPMLLGLAVPNGPPLGSALVTKIDSFVSRMLLPLYFVISGSRIDFNIIQVKTVGVVQILAFLAFTWKLVGALVASLLWEMPFHESLHLGLIMTSQGIIDVLVFSQGTQLMLIDPEIYSIMVLSALAYTAIVSPIVKFLYKPTQTYTAYKRTIQHSRPYGELRMLACIHQADHTPPVINLLEATYPNPENPICMYVVHLIDLVGRSAPVLETHLCNKKKISQSHESYHIINAFRLYEQQKKQHISIFPFTSRSSYASMHDDVCVIANEKRVSMVILPFYTLHGHDDLGKRIRAVNKNILKSAPCSVGILIDHGSLNSIVSTTKCYNIGVLYIGGRDDREALSYGRRMAKNPNTSLTVVHLVEPGKTENSYGHHDFDMINDYQHDVRNKSKQCSYRKEIVNDCVDVANVVRLIENMFDIILVGRTQPNSRPLLEGLSEWNEFPELGFLGDMLASTDTKVRVSVLVVQQQTFGGDETLEDSAVINISSIAKVVNIF